jgi:hypothetical protein
MVGFGGFLCLRFVQSCLALEDGVDWRQVEPPPSLVSINRLSIVLCTSPPATHMGLPWTVCSASTSKVRSDSRRSKAR